MTSWEPCLGNRCGEGTYREGYRGNKHLKMGQHFGTEIDDWGSLVPMLY